MAKYNKMAEASPPGTSALAERLAMLADYARREGSEQAACFQELAAQLDKGQFNLAVFGEFKRGKSTLINALLGQPVLPMGVVPLTSVVTVVAWAEEPGCLVTFSEGGTQRAPIEALGDYVTESGNPRNVKGVDLVEVGFPAPLLKTGLRLVDTPGVGSVYEHNTEAARRYLDSLDGALLVLSADPPISHSEVQFAQEIADRATRIFVVLNKVDRLSDEELQEALSFTRSVLDDFDWAKKVEVLPLSAREALEGQVQGAPRLVETSGIEELQSSLTQFVEREMAASLGRSLARRALVAAEGLQLAAQLQLRSLHLSAEQIEARLVEFSRRRAEVMQQLQDHRDLARAAVGRLVHRRLRADYERVREEGLQRLAREYQQWVEEKAPRQVSRLLEAVNTYVAGRLRAAINQWRCEEEEALGAELGRLLGRFGRQAEEALSQINAAARDVFELPQRRLEAVPVLPAQSHFRWKERDWEIRMGLGGKWYWSLLPPPLLRRAILAEGARKLREHYDLACGRLRHDLENRVNAAAREYTQSVVQALKLALTDLDRVLGALADHGRHFRGTLEEEGRRLEQQVAFLDEQVQALAELARSGGITAGGEEG